MRKLLITCVLAALVTSCESNPSEEIKEVDDISVDQSFNWSSSASGSLEVNLINPHKHAIEEGFVYFLDKDKKVVGKRRIHDSKVVLEYFGPQDVSMFAHYPPTGDLKRITSLEPVDFTLSSTIKSEDNLANKTSGCNVSLINSDAELPVIPANAYRFIHESQVPGWSTTAADHKIEIWSTNFGGVPSVEGNQFIEINANDPNFHSVFQELNLTPGQTYKWSVYHRGRGGVDQADVLIGGDLNTAATYENMIDGTDAWGYYTGTYTVPVGETTTYFIFKAISIASSTLTVGNFIDAFNVTCDSDGDGVPDDEDDYPTDGGKAYNTVHPTVGRQIIGFEDLWPFQGDYDFNDLMVGQNGYLVRNADLELVEAKLSVSIDAIGAGHNNGIGIMWRDLSHDSINSSILSSATGATIETKNTNGMILSNGIFNDISEFYQNNGQGPSKVPDTLKYEVMFKPGFAIDLYPELYIFKTSDRTLEVHRRGIEPTMEFDKSRLNTFDDNGDFATVDGLPWAVEILVDDMYQPPLEHVNMVEAYPDFFNWAKSGGTQEINWFVTPQSDKVFDLSQF